MKKSTNQSTVKHHAIFSLLTPLLAWTTTNSHINKEYKTDSLITEMKVNILKTFNQTHILDAYSTINIPSKKREFNNQIECLSLDVLDLNFHNLIKRKQGRMPPTEFFLKHNYQHQHGDNYLVKQLTMQDKDKISQLEI